VGYGEFRAQAPFFGGTIIMTKSDQQTIVLPAGEAMQLRQEVAEMFKRAVGVLDRELSELAEAGISYTEEGNPVSALTEWAKTAKIVCDQVRRDNPTEHLVPRTNTEDTSAAATAKPPTPKLASLRLKVTG
jgi:hypothetical protein